MRSHFLPGQGVAAVCAVAGASLMLNGNCPAQTFIAADYATNSTYAGGWSAGQNGGHGFGSWSMANTEETSPIEAAIDRTSPYNPFGVAWTLYNPEGSTPDFSPDGCVNPPTASDVSRAGRACPPLQPGQTFSTVIANPANRKFFRGYTLRLVDGLVSTNAAGAPDNTGLDGNNPNAGTQISVGTFEYGSHGRWYTSASYNTGRTSLFDSDTTTNGMQIDITMTSSTTYHLVMTPLDNPAIAYAEDGNLPYPGDPVNWIEFEMYNTDSNFYPDLAPCGPDRTDFYVKSMTISSLTLNIQKLDSNVLLTWATNVSGFALESTPNLGAAALWSPVSPDPAVVNGLNTVTNSIPPAQQFYRLRFMPP